MLRYRDQGSFLLHEFVIMPNHVHLLLTPGSSTSLEKAIQPIKGGSSREIHQRRELRLQIWQPGFHEESIRDLADYQSKRQYIHMNPVRARLVERPENWQYGSASGNFRMDEIPERLKALTSAAEAAGGWASGMPDLKVRPPKKPSVAGLKSHAPQSPDQHTKEPTSNPQLAKGRGA